MKKKQNKNKKVVVLTQQEKETQYRLNRLRYRVQREIQTANKRINNLIKSNLAKSSNAYNYLERLHFDSSKMGYDFLVEKNGRIQFKYSIRGAKWNELERVEKVVSGFLSAKTSSVRGVKKKYTKAYKKYMEETGEELTESEYAEQFTSGLFQQYASLYSSSQAQTFFSTARKNGLTTAEIREIMQGVTDGRGVVTPHREMLKRLSRGE